MNSFAIADCRLPIEMTYTEARRQLIDRGAAIASFGRRWIDPVRDLRRLEYSARGPGFLRMNVCGWRFVLVDTARHRPCYSDRIHCLHLGRFLVRVHRP